MEVKEGRIMKPWEDQRKQLLGSHGSVGLTQPQPVFLLVHRVLLVSPVATPEVSPCLIVISDLRNQTEKLSKGRARWYCQKAKTKIFPTEFIGSGSVEILMCELVVNRFRNKSHVTGSWRVNGKWGWKDSEYKLLVQGAWWWDGRRE